MVLDGIHGYQSAKNDQKIWKSAKKVGFARTENMCQQVSKSANHCLKVDLASVQMVYNCFDMVSSSFNVVLDDIHGYHSAKNNQKIWKSAKKVGLKKWVKSLYQCANMCKHVQTCANMCQQVPTSANKCWEECIRGYQCANMCKHMQTCANM